MDDIGLEIPHISQGYRELVDGRSKRRSTNEQLLIELWQRSGEQLDEQRLRIFRLMSPNQQAELLATIKNIIFGHLLASTVGRS